MSQKKESTNQMTGGLEILLICIFQILSGKYFPEVEPINRQGDCPRKKPGPAEQRPEKKLPVIDSLPAYYSQPENGFYSGFYLGELKIVAPFSKRLRVFEEISNPLVVVFRGIYGFNYFSITGDQSLPIHLGDKVNRKISIIPTGI